MKKFINTLKNIWSIDELRKRILFTIMLLLVYRLGVQIVLPGMDANVLDQLAPAATDGLLGMINMFAGGAFSKASIFALGIMPYISASIAMQLAQIAVPQIQKLQKEESGRKKVQMYTRYLTVVVTLFQAIGYISGILRPQYGAAIIDDTFLWQITTVIVLVSGTLFVMWLGEKITDKGIGNGTSLLIMAGIIARFFPLTAQEWASKSGGAGGGMLIFLLEIAIMIAVIMAIVLLSQAVRRIPINYARRMVGASSAKDISGNRDFIPLKVNSAGVMPIIFAQAIMFIPGLFGNSPDAAPWLKSLGDYTSIGYNSIYFFVVIAFTYLYTAIIINPQQMSDDLKRNNAFIPGVKPGSDTANFIGMVLDRITLPGAVFLAIIGIMPGIAALFGVTQGFAQFYGGTSMLIAVQVILDTLQQIESHLLMRHYDGLTDTGRMGGRQSRTTPTQVANG